MLISRPAPLRAHLSLHVIRSLFVLEGKVGKPDGKDRSCREWLQEHHRLDDGTQLLEFLAHGSDFVFANMHVRVGFHEQLVVGILVGRTP